jgi:hypothetical protein
VTSLFFGIGFERQLAGRARRRHRPKSLWSSRNRTKEEKRKKRKRNPGETPKSEKHPVK